MVLSAAALELAIAAQGRPRQICGSEPFPETLAARFIAAPRWFLARSRRWQWPSAPRGIETESCGAEFCSQTRPCSLFWEPSEACVCLRTFVSRRHSLRFFHLQREFPRRSARRSHVLRSSNGVPHAVTRRRRAPLVLTISQGQADKHKFRDEPLRSEMEMKMKGGRWSIGGWAIESISIVCYAAFSRKTFTLYRLSGPKSAPSPPINLTTAHNIKRRTSHCCDDEHRTEGAPKESERARSQQPWKRRREPKPKINFTQTCSH